MIYFTSDLHLGHDREFMYGPRGYSSITEHDLDLIANINETVTEDDDLYILGDLMLGEYEYGLDLLRQIKGKIHIIIGNHDSDTRVELYKQLLNVVDVKYADMVKYGKYNFYLSHYPTHTGNRNKHLTTQIICLYGHTHQQTNFYGDDPMMYHVGLDSHNMKPVSIEQIIEDIREKKQATS